MHRDELAGDDSTFSTCEGANPTVGTEWYWWLRTKWQRHRTYVTAVHPLLASLDAELGHG